MFTARSLRQGILLGPVRFKIYWKEGKKDGNKEGRIKIQYLLYKFCCVKTIMH